MINEPAPRIEPLSVRVVVIGLPDDTSLRVGMSVEANIISREKLDAVLVPANAVIHNGLFAIEDGRARLRKVEIGIRGTGFVEILQGASEGETIASPATANIKNGSRVRATPLESSAP